MPADQIDAARLDVASTQTTIVDVWASRSSTKSPGDRPNSTRRSTISALLEGELERTITTLGGVKSAPESTLVMATESVFIDRERSAKASVTLKLGRDGLSREETISIQRLVSGAVDGLKPSDVSIIDADSNESLRGASDSNPGEEGAERQLSQRSWPLSHRY